MLTEKDYCDYDTCVALKELGYKVPTSAYYIPNDNQLFFVSNPFRGGYVIDCFYSRNSLPEDVMTSNYIDAPTMWEAQKWLREEKGIEVNASWDNEKSYWFWYISKMADTDFSNNIVSESMYNSCEEALSEGIKQAVKILKKK